MKNGSTVRGFTLIELLTVIVILGILMGLLVGVLQQAKTRARKYKCATEARELARAWQSYYSTYETLPAGGVMNAAMVNILRGNDAGWNPQNIKFMDFPASAGGASGFVDPWGNLYHVSLSVGDLANTCTFARRVYLQNREGWTYE